MCGHEEDGAGVPERKILRRGFTEAVTEVLSVGTCDTCGEPYDVGSRVGRCGNCGECAQHCTHEVLLVE